MIECRHTGKLVGCDTPLTTQNRSVDLTRPHPSSRRVLDSLGACVPRSETGLPLDLTDHLPPVLADLAEDDI